ncbi:MAG: hypothetical protein AAGA48_06900 [Myxococcota bacterium]
MSSFLRLGVLAVLGCRAPTEPPPPVEDSTGPEPVPTQPTAAVPTGDTGPAPVDRGLEFPSDAGVLDVTDPFFGVIPDDGIDDTVALQRLFDLMTPGSLIVYLPEGTYDLSGPVELRKVRFQAEAEDLAYTGWTLQTDGERTWLEATDPGTGPDDAGRITFTFDAIAANRAMSLSHRVPGDNGNAFYYRVNGGEWRNNGRPFNGNDAWRSGVVTTNIPLDTGSNTVEIAVDEPGFAIDSISIQYLSNYLNDTIIQGAGRDRTILRLADGLTDDEGEPLNAAVLGWESGVEQFFRTAVRDLTLDVGQGNPLADGLRFHGNNQSTVADVRIVAGPDSGDVGLDLAHTAAIGPILVRDLLVEGFDVGIHSAWQNASRTFERIEVRNQRTYGWVNEAASTIFVRGLTSDNAVTAFRNSSWRLPGDGQGRVVLIDSTLTGLPGAKKVDAIHSLGNLYARNVSTSGYARALDNFNQAPFRAYRGQDGVDGDFIGEWWTSGANSGDGGGLARSFPGADTMPGLPIEDAPTVAWDPPETWEGPQSFPIELEPGVMSGFPNDGIDDTASIQAAMDSGASTIYLPNGKWTVNGLIEVPATVRRFLGTEASMNAADGEQGVVRLLAGSDPLIVERWASFFFGGAPVIFEHASDRTVVFNDVTGLRYEPVATPPGDLFLQDTVGESIRFVAGQRVWARQLNIETDNTDPDANLPAKIVNEGAEVVVLGFKTESAGVHARTTDGGVTELLGNLQNNFFGRDTPQYEVVDATFGIVVNVLVNSEPDTTYGTVVETQNGVTTEGLVNATGYVALDSATLWDLRGEVVLDDVDGVYEGVWEEVDSFPRGHIGTGYRFAEGEAANRVTYTPELPVAGDYEVYVRWVADWGGQPHSGHAMQATFEVVHAAGTTPTTVNQDVTSDGWFSLGVYGFEAGSAGSVQLSGANADGRILTDGARFVRQ